MRRLLIIFSLLILFAGIILAAYSDISLRPKKYSTKIYIEKYSIMNYSNKFSMRQIDSLSAAVDFAFTSKNAIKKPSL
jgi:hypothetical protein